MLKESVREFLAFLRYNRNVSPHTVRAYETDLTQFVDGLATTLKLRPSELSLAQFDPDAVRDFLGELHRRGLSRASAARRLAAVRTFARYLIREGRLSEDRKSTRLNSSHVSESRMPSSA